MRTTRWRLRIDRSEISYLRFFLEGYEGLASLSTVDPSAGVVDLNIAPGCEADAERLIKDLQGQMLIEEMIGK